jgi:hypothetical protein
VGNFSPPLNTFSIANKVQIFPGNAILLNGVTQAANREIGVPGAG